MLERTRVTQRQPEIARGGGVERPSHGLTANDIAITTGDTSVPKHRCAVVNGTRMTKPSLTPHSPKAVSTAGMLRPCSSQRHAPVHVYGKQAKLMSPRPGDRGRERLGAIPHRGKLTVNNVMQVKKNRFRPSDAPAIRLAAVRLHWRPNSWSTPRC
jgi:hypothetical protein